MSFKVGDWVQHKYLNTIFQVKDIFKDGYLDCITSLKLEPRIKWDSCLFQGKYNSNDCVLWQPIEGEWCWVFDDEFRSELTNRAYVTSDGVIKTHDSCKWKYCEPFIGELPSFLKDK